MDPVRIIQLLILLMMANGSPVIAKRILGSRFSYPLDGGLRFADGRPLLGPSKTIRGIAIGTVAPMLCAPVIGLDWRIGVLVGIGAMVGDILSSFLKRRFNLASSAKAIGIDQIPESLLPLLACWIPLQLTVVDIAVTTAAFFVGEVLLSRLLYRVRIRDQPY